MIPFLLLVLAAQPHLVKDINTKQSPVSSAPGGFATVGNVTYFFANQKGTGNELWRTDGTAGGTTLVRDVWPGPNSGVPTNRVGAPVIGNRVLFMASDGEHGLEWWSSDGTGDGTAMLADIVPGAGGPTTTSIGGDLSTFYFDATSPSAGSELWRSDGTPAGTRLAFDLNPGPANASPRIFGMLGALLVFRASDGTKSGLFTTDGTLLGTQYVAPLFPSSNTTLGPTMLLGVADAGGKWSLWKTDGTSGGTSVVRGGFTGTPPSMRGARGVAYFVADDGVNGAEVWRSDGTASGTFLLADLTPGAAGSQVTAITAMDGNLMILTGGASGSLWFSDGSAAGTRIVKQVPSAAPGVVSGGRYFFSWDDGVHGREVWVSDGTAAGTRLTADVTAAQASGPGFLIIRADGVFFGTTDGPSGEEPWISDGTAAGTRMVRNIAPEESLSSYPVALTNVGGRLFFLAYDGERSAIWTSDGTESGTTPAVVAAEATGTAVSSGSLFYFVAGRLPALELWRTDGTAAGTFSLFRMSESRYIEAMVPFRGGLFFQGSDPEHGAEPRFTDGTVAGTRLLADINPGTSGAFAYTDGTASAGDYVYFPADGLESGPWRTDGTIAGTSVLNVSSSPPEARYPRAFTRVGDWVFFAAYLHDNAFALWKTNIATGETLLVRRFEQRAPWAMWNAGGTLLFTLNGQLWRSDGTESGTTLVSSEIPTSNCFNRQDFAVGDGVLYWYAFRSTTPELWRSDGTAAGTFRLAAFEGPGSNALQTCLPHVLHYASGQLYFIGNDPVHGAEPWVSNGTITGTRMLYDVNPGIASSDPELFFSIGNTLYFRATETTAGTELWAMPIECGICAPRRRAAGH